MAEYTYKDVIIDPEDPRVEIGAEYYMADYPRKAIARANARGDSGVLKSIDKEQNETPFVITHKVSDISWACIIRKETSYEERQAKWVRHKENHPRENVITGLSDEVVYFGDLAIGPEVLLDAFEFVDGSPCGKPANSRQMEEG